MSAKLGGLFVLLSVARAVSLPLVVAFSPDSQLFLHPIFPSDFSLGAISAVLVSRGQLCRGLQHWLRDAAQVIDCSRGNYIYLKRGKPGKTIL